MFNLLDILDKGVQKLQEWSEQLGMEELHEQLVCMNPDERLRVLKAATLIEDMELRNRLRTAAGAAMTGQTVDEFVSNAQHIYEFAYDDQLELAV